MRPIMRYLQVSAAFFVGWLFTPVAWAQTRGELSPGYHMWGEGWGWHGGMFVGFLMMILFVAIIVVLVVLAVRWIGGSHETAARTPPGGRAALDILNERFARGEIDAAEFEERRRLLRD